MIYYETIGEETAEDLKNFRYRSPTEEGISYSAIPKSTVLVVDDVSANLQVARGLLAPYGLHVETADSGREAVELVRDNNYDLILMDQMMPEMDGIETAATIRALEKEKFTTEDTVKSSSRPTPIIALTANALTGMREFYLENGFDDYLSKPISPRALDEILSKWIGETGNSEQKISDNSSLLPVTYYLLPDFATEQRLDMLNHYRAAFESGRAIDGEYYKKFTTFLQTFDSQAGLSAPLREQTATAAMQTTLIEAGQKEDACTIRGTLPAFYKALKSHYEQKQPQKNNRDAEDTLARLLRRLEKALKANETRTADAVIAEMRTANLSAGGQELYVKLYDLMFEEKTEKMLELIKEQNND